MKLYGTKNDRSFRVIWAFAEMDEEFEHVETRPGSEVARTMTPAATVPVLDDDGTIIADSVAILNYVAARFGKLSHPDGTADRARVDAAINFCTTELEAPLWMAARHSFVHPEAERDPQAKLIARDEFARAEEKFAKRLGSAPFVAGDTFTIADIVATHCARWAYNAKFGHRTRAMADYYERMTARPAYLRAAA